jgi:hypothetical protein
MQAGQPSLPTTNGRSRNVATAVRSGNQALGRGHDPMTSDERAQLVEDIKRSDNLRRGIVERAELTPEFDIPAAWEQVEALDASINRRIIAARNE